jgi:hypothetical protein
VRLDRLGQGLLGIKRRTLLSQGCFFLGDDI